MYVDWKTVSVHWVKSDIFHFVKFWKERNMFCAFPSPYSRSWGKHSFKGFHHTMLQQRFFYRVTYRNFMFTKMWRSITQWKMLFVISPKNFSSTTVRKWQQSINEPHLMSGALKTTRPIQTPVLISWGSIWKKMNPMKILIWIEPHWKTWVTKRRPGKNFLVTDAIKSEIR